MHILLVWSYWDIPEVYMESIDALREGGHKVSVLIGDSGVTLSKETLNSHPGFHVAPQFRALSVFTGTPYPLFKNVSEWIKAINPDIVHVHNHLFLASYQALRASHSLHLPTLVSVHAIMAKRSTFLDTLQKLYLRTVSKSIFQKASAIMCLTKGDATEVARILGDYRKITIVPNGVDTESLRPSPNKDRNLIAWVGRLVPEKGLTYLLQAMQEVAKEAPLARLVLAGDGIAKKDMVSLASHLGIGDRVAFLGWTSKKKLNELLRDTSVFAFPSLSEGLPRSILEAMACGAAVVASDLPGTREVITDGQDGILVPTQDSFSLAASILKLLKDDKLRIRMAQNARKTIVERFNRSQSVKLEEALYLNTIRRFSSR